MDISEQDEDQVRRHHVLLTEDALASSLIAKHYLRRHPTKVDRFHLVPNADDVPAYLEQHNLQEEPLLVLTSLHPRRDTTRMDGQRLAENLKDMVPSCIVLTVGENPELPADSAVDGNLSLVTNNEGAIIDLLDTFIDYPEGISVDELARYASGLIHLNR